MGEGRCLKTPSFPHRFLKGSEKTEGVLSQPIFIEIEMAGR